MSDILRWPSLSKDPGEQRSIILSAFTLCAAFWRANEQYELGDWAWPSVTVLNGVITGGAIGYVMECTQEGRSSYKEPSWSVVAPDIPLSKLDGSVQWTPRVAALQGISPVVNPTVASITEAGGGEETPTLTVSDPITIEEGYKMLVTYAAGTLDMSYEVEFKFYVAGLPRIGRQLVTIEKI